MLNIILAFALIWIAVKMFAIGLRVTWGIARIFLPILFIVGLVYVGLVYLTLPIMAVLGLLFLFHFVKT